MIFALPTAPPGSVTTIENYTVNTFPLTSAVLCRNNAPLVGFAIGALGRELAVRLVGRDLELGMEKLIDTLSRDSAHISDFRLALRVHQINESCKAKSRAKREAVEDKCNALMAIARNATTIAEVKQKLKLLFNPTQPALTLSTIHRAKGLEWPTVFLLDFHLTKPRPDDNDAAKQQCRNLQYVAVTRAAVDLVYIQSGGWK